MSRCTYNSNGIRSDDQEHTDMLGHNECIQQGLTDGCIAIIRHDSQEEALSCHKETKEPQLCCTAYERDDFVLGKSVTQHLGSYGRRGSHIYKGQMTKKKST